MISGTQTQVAAGKALVVQRLQIVSQEVGGIQQNQMVQMQMQMYAQQYPGMQQQQQQQHYYSGYPAAQPAYPQQGAVSAAAGSTSSQATIPNNLVGKIIGSGGETLKMLMQQSGCNI